MSALSNAACDDYAPTTRVYRFKNVRVNLNDVNQQNRRQKAIPKIRRIQKSRNETTCYDPQRITHKKLVPEGENVNGEYYLTVSHCLWSRIVYFYIFFNSTFYYVQKLP